MAKKALVWYAHSNTVTDKSVVIETIEDYHNYINDGYYFYHEEDYVRKVLDGGEKIIINSAGGWCTELAGCVEIREILA